MEMTIKQLANQLGVSKTTISKAISALGLQGKLKRSGNKYLLSEVQIANVKSQIANVKSQIANVKSQIANVKSQIASEKSQTASEKSQTASEKSQTANQNALIEVLQKQLSLLNKQLSIKDDRFFLQSILWKDNDLFFCFYGKRPSCSGAVCRTVFLSLYRYFSRTRQGQVRGVLRSTIKKCLFYDHDGSSRIGIVCIYLSTVVIFVNLQTSGYC